MSWPVRHIEKDEAADALRQGAFTVDDPESGDHGRTIVHSFLSGLGADHDLDSALAKVAEADEVAWTTDLLRHDLAVRQGSKVYRYDVPRPERAEAAT